MSIYIIVLPMNIVSKQNIAVMKVPIKSIMGNQCHPGTTSYILDSDLLKKATTEYGVNAAGHLMNLVELKDQDILITLDEMHSLIEEANKICGEVLQRR